MASAAPNPPWRGFNLLWFFTHKRRQSPDEQDFAWIREWGFNFVRLPLSYRTWTKPGDVYAVDKTVLDDIARAVEMGRKHGLHVCLNFHRAPGFCINSDDKEPFDLWKDEAALDAFLFHWRLFAERFRDIPGGELSFNPVNEPVRVERPTHERVIRAFVSAVREIDPDRLIVVDGYHVATSPCPELVDLGVVQSTRFYKPGALTHYRASWIPGSEKFPPPIWPGCVEQGVTFDKEALREWYKPWAGLVRQGVPVHAGEGGTFNTVPHAVTLAWLTDVLDVLGEIGIGWALWNLVGSFGVLDSGRADVAYEDWFGHTLDRKMLEVLQKH